MNGGNTMNGIRAMEVQAIRDLIKNGSTVESFSAEMRVSQDAAARVFEYVAGDVPGNYLAILDEVVLSDGTIVVPGNVLKETL